MSEASSTPEGRKRKSSPSGRPVSAYLLGLVLAILLPALAVALVLLNRTNDTQQDVLQALTNATVQAMGHSVDREITGMATTLRVLSTSLALRDGDLAGFHERATTALVGTGAYLVAVDDSLRQVLNTRVPYGQDLPMTSDPDTARLALRRGIATISGLFFGQVAQRYVFNVWMPVSDAPGVPLIAMTQNASNLVPALQSRQLPEGWHAALVDTDNRIIAATPDAALDIGAVLPVRPDDGETADWQQERLNGEAVVTAEWRSGLTGWRIVAWASASAVQRPLAESLYQLAAWGLIIAIAAGAVAFLIGQRIRVSVQGLRRDAQRLGAGEAVYPRSYPVAELAEVSEALAEASEQRIAAERDNRFLMRELAHRSKNQMAVISAMAKQTARGATDVETYVRALERRIMGLARSTDLLLAHGRLGASLRELVDLQMMPFRPADGRLTVSGEDIRINPQGAQILGMALHELAANAMRYGAFADPEGRTSLDWEQRDETLHLCWRERLGRPLEPVARTGFGTTVLRSMVGGALGAKVEHIAHADGVEWRFAIPLSALDPAFAARRPDEDAEGQ